MAGTTPRTRTSGRIAAHATLVAPRCPECKSSMELHVARRGDRAGRRVWRCKRYPTCNGTREQQMARPARRVPSAATAQSTFERLRNEAWARRQRLPPMVAGAVAALRRGSQATGRTAEHLKGLEDGGFVMLHDRLLPGRRARIDHLLVGPSGIFVVETKSWRGQLAVENERLFVDGRRRDGATEQVALAAAEIQALLAAELKHLGVQVIPVLCFTQTEVPLFKRTIRGVTVTAGRSLSRAVRDRPEVLGPEAIQQLALAADEMLEPANSPPGASR